MENICENCKFYEATEFDPVGYDKNVSNNPKSEGICARLSYSYDGGNCGILVGPEHGNTCVTSNFGCILFDTCKI